MERGPNDAFANLLRLHRRKRVELACRRKQWRDFSEIAFPSLVG
jgi:hypothetical protein